MAETQASSAAVKKFAGKMISAHTASTAKLKGIASGMSPAITPDDTLNPDQQAAIESLKGQKGAAFDSAYAAAQVDGHQKTLDALKAYAASGDNAKLKGFANDMIPIVTAHLNMAKGLKVEGRQAARPPQVVTRLLGIGGSSTSSTLSPWRRARLAVARPERCDEPHARLTRRSAARVNRG